MTPRIAILGRGKLATALARVFTPDFSVHMLTREHFDAHQPESIDPLLEALKPVAVFNTVVLGGLDACAKDPHAALAVNALFPVHLAKRCQRHGATLVHFSTDSVFADTPAAEARVESSPAQPPNVYGYTKFGADCLIPLHTPQYLVYRLPVLFGPAPEARQFLERMLLRLRAGESLSAAADVYSHAVYSLDVARAVKAHMDQSPVSGLYHLAGSERASLYELLAHAAALLRIPGRLQKARADDFPGLDYKNRAVHLASEKLPPLRPWKEALHEYCKELQ